MMNIEFLFFKIQKKVFHPYSINWIGFKIK